MRVLETTLKPALVPLKRTEFVPEKLVPSMTTLVPTGPVAGRERGDRGPGGLVT
jgi:hypothetical protein